MQVGIGTLKSIISKGKESRLVVVVEEEEEEE